MNVLVCVAKTLYCLYDCLSAHLELTVDERSVAILAKWATTNTGTFTSRKPANMHTHTHTQHETLMLDNSTNTKLAFSHNTQLND